MIVFAAERKWKNNSSERLDAKRVVVEDGHFSAGGFDDVLLSLQAAEDVLPGDPPFSGRWSWPTRRNKLGIALQQRGDADSAISEFRTARRLRPQGSGCRKNLGAAYLQREDFAAAASVRTGP